MLLLTLMELSTGNNQVERYYDCADGIEQHLFGAANRD